MSKQESHPGACVGKAVRDARTDDRMGQRHLARQAGISSGYLSRIESGDVANVSEDVIFQLADSLGRSRFPLAYLGHHFDGAALIVSSELGRRMLEGWSSEDEAQLESRPDQQLLIRLAHALFVEIRLADLLEELGFGIYDQLLAQAAACTEERRRALSAFAAEQAVLSDLDRRSSNPAPMRLVGCLADPEDEARYQRIMERFHSTPWKAGA